MLNETIVNHFWVFEVALDNNDEELLLSNLEKNFLHEDNGVIAFVSCNGSKDNSFVYGIKVTAQ